MKKILRASSLVLALFQSVNAQTVINLLEELTPTTSFIALKPEGSEQLWKSVYGNTSNYSLTELPETKLLIAPSGLGGGIVWLADWERLKVSDAKKVVLELELNRESDTEGEFPLGIRLTTQKQNKDLLFLEFWGEGDGFNLVGSGEKQSIKKSLPVKTAKAMQLQITVDLVTQRATVKVDGDVVGEDIALRNEVGNGIGLFINHPAEWGNTVMIRKAVLTIE